MSFSWDELVMIGIIKYLGDPGLVLYFMNILKPMKNLHIENEAREFHCSIRLSVNDRWKKSKEYREKRLFYMMTSIVPITCPIPFSNKEWEINSRCIRTINYFRKGFMMISRDFKKCFSIRRDQTISEKVMCLSRILNMYTSISLRELEEAYFDFILFDDDDDRPYIMLDYDYDGQPFINIIN